MEVDGNTLSFFILTEAKIKVKSIDITLVLHISPLDVVNIGSPFK